MNQVLQADQDLDAQQQHLSSTSYDLRITNLARFIYKKITSSSVRHSELDSESRKKQTGFRVGARNDKFPTLIDIGAGNGLFLKFFKQKGFKVAGIELEQENVDNMKKDTMLKGDDIRQGDITQLTGDESYDVVIASDVIEHIKDDVKAIQGYGLL